MTTASLEKAIRIAVAGVIALAGLSLSATADPADTGSQTQVPPSASWPMPPALPTPAPPTVLPVLPLLPPPPAGASYAVLYEEDASNPTGNRLVGAAFWRTETVSPGEGKPAVAVRADIEIPERQMSMTWTLRRATELDSASHTVDISFKLPPDFPSGGILNVPGVLMKDTEQRRGVALAGLSVKVTTGIFLIGLSNAPADREKNERLLKESGWLDIPFVYTNNRRAILALEKGAEGERAFAQAFAEWEK